MIKLTTKLVFFLSLIPFPVCAYRTIKCQQDYHKVLGVPKDADDSQIKQAFKKLSLSYHPDKNPDNEEHAKQQFFKVAQAYQALIDPESIKSATTNFGDGRGYPGPPQDHHHQQDQQHEPRFQPEFSIESDVGSDKIDNIAAFYRRMEVWLILFYKGVDPKTKNYVDVWKEVAEKLHGIVRVAAIDCDGQAEEALCEDFSLYEVPKILVFPANSRAEPIITLALFNMAQLPHLLLIKWKSFVKLVTENNYESLTSEDFEKPKIILFTSKKATPPLFKALSKEFKGRITLVEIRESSESLVKRFCITRFPTIMALTDADSYSGTIYDGELKKDQIAKF